MPRHARGVADALDLGPVTLVGLSLGGGVAMQVALDRPDLLARLVPIGPYGLGRDLPNGRLSYALARAQVCNRLAVAPSGGVAGSPARASRGSSTTSTACRRPPSTSREMQRPTAGTAFRRFRDSEVTRDGYRTTFTGRFGELSVPTHFLQGAHDAVFPVAWAKAAAGRVPDADLTVLDDCGHWVPRESPDAVATHISSAASDR